MPPTLARSPIDWCRASGSAQPTLPMRTGSEPRESWKPHPHMLEMEESIEARRRKPGATWLKGYDGPRARTWDQQVTRLAPGEEVSQAISMLARVPVLLRLLDARMSSIPRSRMTMGDSRLDVNRRVVPRVEVPSRNGSSRMRRSIWDSPKMANSVAFAELSPAHPHDKTTW
jgi:hypothetical protein